ncbi:MAG TPA: hypothetical protein VJ044_19120, partial [Candidatus Hodarchaeales archaeon]|nr:hypothetical protein [Candidatus Hodarchaeales archaeon]
AVFERKIQSGIPNIVLTGFEVKGFGKKSGKAPPFAHGLDQALVLLHQGADFAYLVHPEPQKNDDKIALNELCTKYAPLVGLIFVPHDLTQLTIAAQSYRHATRNPHTTAERKRKMLTSLLTWGLRDEISDIPLWCKKQEY